MAASLVLALVLPVAGLLAVLLAGGRFAREITLGFLAAGGVVTTNIVAGVWKAGTALVYESGGWSPPLGITLRADGLSAVMLGVTVVVLAAVALSAPRDFSPDGKRETRLSLTFWFLLLAVWMGLNAVFLGHDLFNLYVALEVIAFAGVPLVCLKGTAETYRAALRYLIFALIGSAFYLLGAVLLYGAYGTLDLTLLSERVHPQPALWLALALMTAGLAAKTALFPLHLWLPPAHAGAPPAASALLSALVVKGSFFLAVRLWFDLAPDLIPAAAWQIPGVMGAGAILVGGVMALRQERLKLLIAYSTVAQIGYLFLIFPLAAGPTALAGGMLQAVSHAFAKAAMFLAAGLLAEAAGSDRLVDLRGTGRALPVTVLALGLAAVSLLGVPPTGGFLAKWLLLGAAVSTEQWGWAVVLFAGGLLAGGYLYRAVLPATREGTPPSGPLPSLARQFVVLALALGALGVGMFPAKPLELLQIGRPVAKEVR